MHESGILHDSSEMGVLTVTERGALDESDFDFDERLMTDLVRGIRRVCRPWTSRRLPVVASVLTSRQFTLLWGGTMARSGLCSSALSAALRHPALDVGNQLFGGCRPQRIRPGAEWSSNAFNRGRGLRGDPLTTLALSGRAQVRVGLGKRVAHAANRSSCGSL